MSGLWDQYGCYTGSDYENRIVDWMAEHGHPGSRSAIRAGQDAYLETVGEAGRYWMHCPFTQTQLVLINATISEEFQAATDRYEDWASD
jgi:hypothetical protein